MKHIVQNEYLTIETDTAGGQLTSIKNKDGLEFLWQKDPAYWNGSAPILFPICGSIRNDTAMNCEGYELHMPRHGIVRKKEFAREKAYGDSVGYSISSNEETMQQYPYPFLLTVRYTLKDNTITVSLTVKNTGSKTMPYLLGGHPAFNCPLLKEEDYEDYYLEFEQEETLDVPTPVTETGLIDVEHRTPFLDHTNTLRLSHDLFAKDAVILDQLKSRSVTLKSDKNSHTLKLTFKDFPYLILWSTANNGPFIALEPWMGLSTCSDEGDLFEEKRNMQYVQPGEEKTASFTIEIDG